MSVVDSPPHFDLKLAREVSTSNDFLVLRLDDLVRMAFITATSDIESLRPVGILAIRDIVEVWSRIDCR